MSRVAVRIIKRSVSLNKECLLACFYPPTFSLCVRPVPWSHLGTLWDSLSVSVWSLFESTVGRGLSSDSVLLTASSVAVDLWRMLISILFVSHLELVSCQSFFHNVWLTQVVRINCDVEWKINHIDAWHWNFGIKIVFLLLLFRRLWYAGGREEDPCLALQFHALHCAHDYHGKLCLIDLHCLNLLFESFQAVLKVGHLKSEICSQITGSLCFIGGLAH